MKAGVRPSPTVAVALAGDLQRIAQRLQVLSEAGVARGMTHTEGVDHLIGLIDGLDDACARTEERAGGLSRPERAATEFPGGPGCSPVKDLTGLCRDIRRRAADLDRLNRDGVGVASELGELAAEIMRLEDGFRRWLVSTTESQAV